MERRTAKSYLDEIDKWIEDRLYMVSGAGDNADAVISVVKDDIKSKIRESYFNGVGKRPSKGGGFVKEAVRQIKGSKSRR